MSAIEQTYTLQPAVATKSAMTAKSARKIALLAGLLGVYAILLCPFIIATPKSGASYLIARLFQLMSILIWVVLHLKNVHPVHKGDRFFVYSSHLWWVALIAITFACVPTFQFTQINYWITVWNILLLAEMYWHKDFARHLLALSLLFSFLVYLSAILYVLFPDGLWVEEDWVGAGDNERFLFGNYNQTGIISLMALLICGTYSLLTKRGYLNMLVLSAVSIAMVVAMGSMTSSVGLILVTLYFFLRRLIKHPMAWIVAFLLVYVLFFVVIVWRGNDIQNWPVAASFVENVLGKDSTFTMRIFLWIESIAMILASPWIGYGAQSVEWMVSQIGGSGPHNLWLMVLLRGGIVLCTIMIALFVAVFRKAMKNRGSRSAFAAVCICVTLVMSLFESYHFICIFTILILAYYACAVKSDKKKKPVVQA